MPACDWVQSSLRTERPRTTAGEFKPGTYAGSSPASDRRTCYRTCCRTCCTRTGANGEFKTRTAAATAATRTHSTSGNSNDRHSKDVEAFGQKRRNLDRCKLERGHFCRPCLPQCGAFGNVHLPGTNQRTRVGHFCPCNGTAGSLGSRRTRS